VTSGGTPEQPRITSLAAHDTRLREGPMQHRGEASFEVRPGDCVSLSRGSEQGHQIANGSRDEDLVYLTIGENRADEICVYPDTGKVLVRGLTRLVQVEDVDYFDGEPGPPLILGEG
jgi:uncharacterized cupin superfamily protein